jgi:hypothetical protein
VGLKSHSEIGWVLREYKDLINKAQKFNLKSPDSYYIDGKTKGKVRKDTGIETNKTVEKADVFVKKVDASGIIGLDDDIEEIGIHTSQEKPSLIELPTLIRKSKASEIPGLLEGFKSHRRK